MRRIICISCLVCILAVIYKVSYAQQADNIPTTYQTESDVFYYDSVSPEPDEYMKERCRLELYYPSNKTNFPTVVWFHGGGLKGGNRSIASQLKNQNIAVAAVNYRLSPRASCPAYIEDAAAAVAWVFKNIQKYGGSPELIFVSGHSAGGYLTSMIGLDKRWLARHRIDADSIAGLIPFSGQTITHSTIREERGMREKQPIIDEFAPLFHIRPDASPLLLITGDRNMEMNGRYEENAYLIRMMMEVGHKNTTLYELQGFDHGGMDKPAYYILLKHIENKLRSK